MISHTTERRVERSNNPGRALACLLESTRRKQQLYSVALADDSGLLVAGAGSARDCDEIAAWAPLVAAGQAPPGSPEALCGVRLKGFDAYLCARGPACSPGELAETAAGCTRILRACAA